MSEPLIDILMATYSGERYVGEQIESIRAQTYKNWRLLVSDDCSSDGTLDVVRRYAEEDARIRIVSEDIRYGGARENFFALMRMTDANYIMFCDQDDFWLTEKIEKSLVAMRGLEDQYGADAPLLVFSDMKVVDCDLNLMHESFEECVHFDPMRLAFRQLLAQNVAAGCTMILNRKLLGLCLYSDGVGAEMHDWWAMLLASAFGHIGFIDEPLSLYRQHGSNEVGANEYDFIERAKNADQTIQNFVVAADQAIAFESAYGKQLDARRLRSLRSYIIARRDTSPLRRICSLVLSGCWKRGARKLGQLFAAATAPEYK